MTRWLQISSGRGPAECEWVVAKLAATLCDEAKSLGLVAEPIESIAGAERDTLRSFVMSLAGPSLDAFLEKNVGTVQWIGRSPFRPGHRRKNWFVGVEVFSPPTVADFDRGAVRFETCRASGPGGQHVNKTESAVRAIHLPTGITVACASERSLHQNKQTALLRLAWKLERLNQEEAASQQAKRWQVHNELERGNAVRVFVGERFLER